MIPSHFRFFLCSQSVLISVIFLNMLPLIFFSPNIKHVGECCEMSLSLLLFFLYIITCVCVCVCVLRPQMDTFSWNLSRPCTGMPMTSWLPFQRYSTHSLFSFLFFFIYPIFTSNKSKFILVVFLLKMAKMHNYSGHKTGALSFD